MNIEKIRLLRQETGAGLMDCKNALIEANGDDQHAMALLFEKGFHLAKKKAERVAADGIAYARVFGDRAVLLAVNSETDFTAGHPAFLSFVAVLAEVIARQMPKDIDDLMSCFVEEQGKTVAELLQKMILRFRENLVIRGFETLTGPMPIAYMHQNGRIGVILNLSDHGSSDRESIRSIGMEIAMQIAAMHPRFVSRSELTAETILSIRQEITEAVNEDEGLRSKPSQVRDKIVNGRLEKYFATNCLMEQASIRDDSWTVRQYIDTMAGQTIGRINVTQFYRFEKGEGLLVEGHATDAQPIAMASRAGNVC